MFDYVKHEVDCPTCGKPITEFQTKDTQCEMDAVQYWETDHFYSPCDYCDTWVDFYRKNPKPYVPISDYEMKFTPSEKPEKCHIRNEEGRIVGFQGCSE